MKLRVQLLLLNYCYNGRAEAYESFRWWMAGHYCATLSILRQESWNKFPSLKLLITLLVKNFTRSAEDILYTMRVFYISWKTIGQIDAAPQVPLKCYVLSSKNNTNTANIVNFFHVAWASLERCTYNWKVTLLEHC